MIVIAMIALLIALLSPSLGQARKLARDAVSLANIRGHAAIFNTYAGSNSDAWPIVVNPKATKQVLWVDDRTPLDVRGYFWTDNSWSLALAPEYYEGKTDHPSLFYPGRRPWPYTSYYYGNAFIARPEFWNRETRTNPEQWGLTRVDEVTFPSAKALLWCDHYVPDDPKYPNHLSDDPATVAFCDGHAGKVPLANATAPYPFGSGDWPTSPGSGGGKRFGDTVDGVRGRDVR